MAVNFKHPKSRTRITDLDDNLVIEILSHLPYQYVMVGKSVCKLWNSLVSTPYFVRRFLRHRLLIPNRSVMEEERPWTFLYTQGEGLQLTSTHSVFKSDGFSFSFVPCYQPQNFEPIGVVSNFNDLVLCCELKVKQSVYYICNPITMQFVALPPAPIDQESLRLCVDFICEPYYQKHQNPHQHDDVDVVLNAQYRFWVMRVQKFIYTSNRELTLEIFSSEFWNETMGGYKENNEIFVDNKRFHACLQKKLITLRWLNIHMLIFFFGLS